jgi:hypothetical protein
VPQDSYVITAFVQHLQGNDLDEIGLFFALSEYDTPAGRTYVYGAFLFTDAEVQDRQRKLNKPRFQFTLIRNIDVLDPSMGRHFNTQQPTLTEYRPAVLLPEASRWRKLQIVVRPDRIEAFFDNELSARVTRKQWVEVVRGLTVDNDGGQGQEMTIDLRGGFGLLSYSGIAAFKNVTVQRLAPNE